MWIRIDDKLPTNPKVMELSNRAFRAYITALCHCGQHLTDGIVSRTAAKRLAIAPRTQNELLEARLITPQTNGSGGFEIHDYLVYNPSADEVKEKQGKGRERVRKHRATSRNAVSNALQEPAGNGVTKDDCNGVSNDVPSRPVPFLPPSGAESARAPGFLEKYPIGTWMGPNTEAKAQALDSGLDVTEETKDFIDYHKGSGRQSMDWDADFRRWMRRSARMAQTRSNGPKRKKTPEERRIDRNDLLDEAKAGKHGTKAKLWHDSGKDLRRLADILEAGGNPADEA